ncbi:hypothetical protein P186_0293 [Pyrobaculum ferrireducens]|uniref:Uncharacterized protein n=1 Tax=Pyrobaculum ferrireducens TaxID=1104324 RepID=G7VFU5_9CREN|nr:hypothetical protein P186_0293 [Pyrobaculum ferrireducens]
MPTHAGGFKNLLQNLQIYTAYICTNSIDNRDLLKNRKSAEASQSPFM